MKKTKLFGALLVLTGLLSSCGSTTSTVDDSTNDANSLTNSDTTTVDPNKEVFEYEDITFTDKLGDKTNGESHPYDELIVNKLDNKLRDDFAYGVDASMIAAVEANGGVYYNEAGQEQDVFQILRKNGVNFLRLREWVQPMDKYNRKYGGGDNNVTVNIPMAKRAKEANMNVMIDFHYSDFWADPDTQWRPKSWGTLEDNEVGAKIQEYTKQSLDAYKAAGITIDAVQIGNETNNGMAGYTINWNNVEQSFDMIASYMKGGIAGAKASFPEIKTMIHLANGGNTVEFEKYFLAMDARGVDYDIIGASFYPHLSGTLQDLQNNLNNIAEKTGKYVMIAEMSWGYTTASVVNAANSYSAGDEDVGGYLTGEQSQATAMRDVFNVLANVDNNRGLGFFYWEPAWLPVAQSGAEYSSGWATTRGQSYKYYGNDQHSAEYTSDGLASWCNQGLFSYTGKALSSLQIFNVLNEGKNEIEEVSTKARKTSLSYTINLAADETLPATAKVETNLGAIRSRNVVWTPESIELVKTKGNGKQVSGLLDNQYPITATVNCIENFIVDPGFENQGTTDNVKEPWIVESSTPVGDTVVKLDRKKDIRSGITDLNWYHSTSEFTFDVSQTINNLPAGEYSLTTYIMAVAINEIAHTSLYLYISINDGTPITLDMCSSTYLAGWSAGYKSANISSINIAEGDNVKVGIKGSAVAGAWAHNDDWELVNNN